MRCPYTKIKDTKREIERQRSPEVNALEFLFLRNTSREENIDWSGVELKLRVSWERLFLSFLWLLFFPFCRA